MFICIHKCSLGYLLKREKRRSMETLIKDAISHPVKKARTKKLPPLWSYSYMTHPGCGQAPDQYVPNPPQTELWRYLCIFDSVILVVGFMRVTPVRNLWSEGGLGWVLHCGSHYNYFRNIVWSFFTTYLNWLCNYLTTHLLFD